MTPHNAARMVPQGQPHRMKTKEAAEWRARIAEVPPAVPEERDEFWAAVPKALSLGAVVAVVGGAAYALVGAGAYVWLTLLRGLQADLRGWGSSEAAAKLLVALIGVLSGLLFLRLAYCSCGWPTPSFIAPAPRTTGSPSAAPTTPPPRGPVSSSQAPEWAAQPFCCLRPQAPLTCLRRCPGCPRG